MHILSLPWKFCYLHAKFCKTFQTTRMLLFTFQAFIFLFGKGFYFSLKRLRKLTSDFEIYKHFL